MENWESATDFVIDVWILVYFSQGVKWRKSVKVERNNFLLSVYRKLGLIKKIWSMDFWKDK